MPNAEVGTDESPGSALGAVVKVLIAGGGTGGHLMPALALARAFGEVREDVEVVLAGATRGIEADLFARYSFRYHLLPIEPIYRAQWWRNVRWPALAWRLIREVDRLLAAEAPDVVVGTGGYAAGPVVWRAQRRRIPTAIQEQNAFPGLTTRLLARRARQIHLGFPEARARLRAPQAEFFSFGNPIRPPDPGDRAEAARSLGLEPDRRIVAVFGGSQGARGLNYAVAGALEHRDLGEINLIWGTGAAQIARYQGYARPGRVVVQGFFDPMTALYRAADLVVCRAGAITIAELCAWGKASVLVPLPTAAADHQTFNARALADAGASILLPEAELSGKKLMELVRELFRNPDRLAAIAKSASGRGHPDAARLIVSKILTLAG